MPLILIPSKGLSGQLSRGARSFTPGGVGGLSLMGITVNWAPGQSSGPVSFAFTLNQPMAGFPAGEYGFAGLISSRQNPCPGDALACGTVKWPDNESDEVPWEATGGPIEDDTEELSENDEPSEDEESSEDEGPSACGEKADNE